MCVHVSICACPCRNANTHVPMKVHVCMCDTSKRLNAIGSCVVIYSPIVYIHNHKKCISLLELLSLHTCSSVYSVFDEVQ